MVEEADGDVAVGVNEVRLVGRVSGEPEIRLLPSGDEIVQLRVVVRRPAEKSRTRPAAAADGATVRPSTGPGVKGLGHRATADTIDVSCWTAITRRTALRLTAGDPVEVEGALRRRFYRAGAAVQSRYDVVARAVRRPRRAAQ